MHKKDAGMSLIVKTVTRMTAGFILLFGIYIVVHGHRSPGGGFTGGVIIALSVIYLMIAFGRDAVTTRMSKYLGENLESAGALMFLAIACVGFFGGAFLNMIKGGTFSVFDPLTMPLSDISIGFKVGVGLFVIFLALIILQGVTKEK